MLRNVVSPAYDATETVPYKYGMHYANDTSATNRLYWSDYDGAIGNEDGAHMIVINPWEVTAGAKSITEFRLHGNFMGSANNTAAYIEVWKKDGLNFVRVAQSSNLIATIGASVVKLNLDISSAPFAVTLESGVEYWYGMHFVRNDSGATSPQPNGLVDTDFTKPCYIIGLSAAWADLTTIPIAGSGSAPYAVVAEENTRIGMEIKYTTTNYIEQDITSDTIGKHEIARPQDRTGFIKLEGVVVADTNALTISHQYINATTWETTTFATAELDCGDTTLGQNDIIYEGNTVNLPDLDPAGTGAEGQEGKTFDLIFGITENVSGHPYALKNDLYWQCRHLEDSVHSHAVADSGTRTTKYDHTEPMQYMTTAGTATIAKIRVGTNPAILCGDSQTNSGYNELLRTPNTNGWGAFPTSLTKERMWILQGKGGAKLGDHPTAVWASSTPGEADGRELVGLGGLWCWMGMGVNDISAATTATVADEKEIVTGLMNDLSGMLEVIAAAGDRVILAGLPPYSDAVLADAHEAAAIRRWNRAMLGIALANSWPFYNAWPDMVQAGTEGDSIPTFLAAFTTDSGTHFSAAGGAVAVLKLVLALENATIDLRDAWN